MIFGYDSEEERKYCIASFTNLETSGLHVVSGTALGCRRAALEGSRLVEGKGLGAGSEAMKVQSEVVFHSVPLGIQLPHLSKQS